MQPRRTARATYRAAPARRPPRPSPSPIIHRAAPTPPSIPPRLLLRVPSIERRMREESVMTARSSFKLDQFGSPRLPKRGQRATFVVNFASDAVVSFPSSPLEEQNLRPKVEKAREEYKSLLDKHVSVQLSPHSVRGRFARHQACIVSH